LEKSRVKSASIRTIPKTSRELRWLLAKRSEGLTVEEQGMIIRRELMDELLKGFNFLLTRLQ
jgi:hypothetical protein